MTPSAGRARAWTCLLLTAVAGCGADEDRAPVVRWLSTEPARPVLYSRELLDPREWTRDAGVDARFAHSSGGLTPNLEPSPELGPASDELRAIQLGPRGAVSHVVRSNDQTVDFAGFAGVDRAIFAEFPPDSTPWTFEFEVLVDGVAAWSDRVVIRNRRGARRNLWKEFRVAGLEPGQRVTLVTRTDGLPEELPSGLVEDLPRVGFGGLVFERRHSVSRMRASVDYPNAIFIVVDTLRADHLGCYGYERDTTPHIDALAARGTLFEECAATSSWTWPSTASLLTGLTPVEHGVQSYVSGYLRGELTTLAEAALAQGTATAAFSGNPLIGPHKNYQQGFEHFDYDLFLRDSNLLVPRALEWIDERGDERFFLYLHLVDPHAPYLPDRSEFTRLFGESAWPSGELPAFVSDTPLMDMEAADNPLRNHTGPWDDADFAAMRRAYDACIATLDAQLGVLVNHLAARGLEDTTAIVLTSDHGEEIGDRGLFGHGQSIHRELVRVPLILAGPGMEAGARRTVPFSNRHVAPGLARWCRWEMPGLDVDLDAAPPADDVFFFTARGWWNRNEGRRIAGLRRGDWVLHWTPDAGEDLGPRYRLFDLRDDLDERVDRSEEQAATTRDLLRVLESHWAEGADEAVTLEEGAALDRLRGIGYVGDD